MSGEEVAGIAVTVFGLGGFGALLYRRGRAVRAAAGKERPGGLRAWQAMASPTGEWIAVVRSGPAFDGRWETLLESALLALLWFFPVRICRIELAILRAGPAGDTRALTPDLFEETPVALRTLWRGQGSPQLLGLEVRLSWTGPRAAAAVLRGTTFSIELPQN